MTVKIQADEFSIFTKFIYGISGIHLDDSKTYLIETRLAGLLQETNCATFTELYKKVISDPSKTLHRKIIDAITTNETLFFRDTSPFEMLQHKVLPDLIDKRSKKGGMGQPNIRIWSAACSTGQEIYSIAIVLKELLGDVNKYKIKLLGTDISDQAVARASRGYYNKFEIERGLPKDKLLKYFISEKDSWKIKDEVRLMASFQKINLMDSFNSMGRFDIIFCRNVAIYFAEQDKIKLFDKIAGVLEPDGYLIIGSTESLSTISTKFEPKRYLRSVFYQIKGQA